ncbi:MAG: hypothetical protein ACYDCK_11765, partial [Thermoplasmatota archaeon]
VPTHFRSAKYRGGNRARGTKIEARKVLIGLLLSGVTVALVADAATNSTSQTPAQQSALRAWQQERHVNLSNFRNQSISQFRTARDSIDESHDINLTTIQVALLQGRIQAIRDCRAEADPFPANASGPHSGVYRSCMAHDLKGLHENASSARAAEQANYVASLKAARESAKASFASKRDAWLAANPKP